MKRLLVLVAFVSVLLVPHSELGAQPLNDDACDAEVLFPGVAASVDNSGATMQPGEVSPGAGSAGCNSQDGWCSSETGVQNSVWYSFEAPFSGCVSVASTPSDLQLAVYDVGDCADFSTFTALAANDDSGPIFAPLVEELSGLTPGQGYYVQLDGWNGALATQDSILLTACPLEGIAIDLKPGSCPNPLNTRSSGVLPTAILGSGDFDVTMIDPATVALEGVPPLRWRFADVSRPLEVPPGIAVGPAGHLYTAVAAPHISWDDAKMAAEATSFAGLPGHLATSTSAAENDFLDALRIAAGIVGPVSETWLGGLQLPNQATPGDGWSWTTGEGPIPGTNAGPGYANWFGATGEPNDSDTVEDNQENHLALGFFDLPAWNDEGDLANVGGYLVEIEAALEDDCDVCWEAGPDGHVDLTLKFDTQAIVAAMGIAPVCRGVTMTGALHDGTPFTTAVDRLRVRTPQLTCAMHAAGEMLANDATGNLPAFDIQEHRCAEGEALVGFEGRSGVVMDQLTYHCRTLKRNCSAGGEITLTSVHGTSPGGSAFGPLYCAANEFITSLDLRIGDGTDRIQGRCRHAADIAAGASNSEYTSETPPRGTLGGNPTSTVCPDGYVAVGVRGGYRSGYGWPNSFQLICQPVDDIVTESACGIGFELALLLPPLMWLRGRRS